MKPMADSGLMSSQDGIGGPAVQFAWLGKTYQPYRRLRSRGRWPASSEAECPQHSNRQRP
jgi:hypothetical protein